MENAQWYLSIIINLFYNSSISILSSSSDDLSEEVILISLCAAISNSSSIWNFIGLAEDECSDEKSRKAGSVIFALIQGIYFQYLQ